MYYFPCVAVVSGKGNGWWLKDFGDQVLVCIILRFSRATFALTTLLD